MTKHEATMKAIALARALARTLGYRAAIWYAGPLTRWEYGVVVEGLSWVEYVS
jgi:hypothetical protein